MQINGEAAPGVSSGDAMAEVERLVRALPPGFGVEWTGTSYQERQAGAQTPLLYSLSLLMVFLCLAALYESWSVPTAVMLVAPLGILGAVLANTLRAPSLKGIGQAQKPPYLVESILAPSAILKTGFETERIETADGRVLTGLVKEEGESLRVITADDEKLVKKGDVEERAVLKLSLMPEGQERLMSPAELSDLVEYLISLR